jgi:hypothetical protein
MPPPDGAGADEPPPALASADPNAPPRVRTARAAYIAALGSGSVALAWSWTLSHTPSSSVSSLAKQWHLPAA